MTVTMPAPNEIAEKEFTDVPLTKVPGGVENHVRQLRRRRGRPPRRAAVADGGGGGAPPAAAPPADPAPPVVKRREIRRMPGAGGAVHRGAPQDDGEQDGPETSPFSGSPATTAGRATAASACTHCTEHRQETFPGGTARTVAFEKGLQEADRALGNDGQIALRSVMDEPEVNGWWCPILRKHFPNDTEKMRALLADPSVKGDGTGDGKRGLGARVGDRVGCDDQAEG